MAAQKRRQGLLSSPLSPWCLLLSARVSPFQCLCLLFICCLFSSLVEDKEKKIQLSLGVSSLVLQSLLLLSLLFVSFNVCICLSALFLFVWCCCLYLFLSSYVLVLSPFVYLSLLFVAVPSTVSLAVSLAVSFCLYYILCPCCCCLSPLSPLSP